MEDLVLRSQLHYGFRLDPKENKGSSPEDLSFRGFIPTPLSPAEFRADWQKLREKYPADFTVTPAQILAWHQREAAAAFREQNAAASLFHYFHSSWEWAFLLAR